MDGWMDKWMDGWRVCGSRRASCSSFNLTSRNALSEDQFSSVGLELDSVVVFSFVVVVVVEKDDGESEKLSLGSSLSEQPTRQLGRAEAFADSNQDPASAHIIARSRSASVFASKHPQLGIISSETRSSWPPLRVRLAQVSQSSSLPKLLFHAWRQFICWAVFMKTSSTWLMLPFISPKRALQVAPSKSPSN